MCRRILPILDLHARSFHVTGLCVVTKGAGALGSFTFLAHEFLGSQN
jgi:hypothetical protein